MNNALHIKDKYYSKYVLIFIIVSISELLLWFLIRRSEASFGDVISNKIYKFNIFCKHQNRKMGESRNARHRKTKDELQQNFNMTV